MAEESSALAGMLFRAGLNGAKFAKEINLRLSVRGCADRVIHSTAPYHWIRNGFMPYEPIPAIAAEVLSERLGMPVSVRDMWPDHRRGAAPEMTAVHDLDSLATLEDAVYALGETVSFGAGEEDVIGAADGSELLAAVHDGLDLPTVLDAKRGRERVLPPQVDLIAAHVTALRRQDDRHGGGTLSLRYVMSELRGVLDLVRYADYEPDVGRRLLTIVADLAQLVGWVQFDAGRYGAAERHLLLSQRIAQGVNDLGRMTNVIGMLAYVSAFAGHGQKAMQIAAAAEDLCPPDPVLRARIAGRVATAAAAAGDLSRFRQSSEEARRLLATADAGAPSYLYYMEPTQLVAEKGQGLVALAKQVTTYRKRLLDEAVDLLGPISQIGDRPDYPRSALIHGCFLTEAQLGLGDPEAAVFAARAAVTRLPDVQSLRGKSYLRRLRTAFARRKRCRTVAAFMPEFDAALSQR